MDSPKLPWFKKNGEFYPLFIKWIKNIYRESDDYTYIDELKSEKLQS